MRWNRNFFTVETRQFTIELDYYIYDIFSAFAEGYRLSIKDWFDTFVTPVRRASGSVVAEGYVRFTDRYDIRLTKFELSTLNQASLTQFGLSIEDYFDKNIR